ncbi:MAG: hypothetical protein JNJ41_13045 [Bacteroidia bacterium]|nr:hypothetical protein [Bacteroidia bacterium]
MNNFIIYSIEIAISLALFYTAYWVFLKNETFFKLNRIYLIASVIISLLTPLLNINVEQDSFVNKLLLPIDQYEQSIVGNRPIRNVMNHPVDYINKTGSGFTIAKNSGNNYSGQKQFGQVNSNEITIPAKKTSWLRIILTIYFIGVGLFLLRFLANCIWIFGYVLKNKPQELFGMKVIRIEKNISPFSFLNFMFISNKDYPEAELSKIISHEKVHIQQKHSIDIIFFELLLVLQWFNPFAWLNKRAIRITHEYLADEGTLNSGIEMSGYQYSLLNQALSENNFEIANSYNFSIKKRIEMMMKKRSAKIAALKLVVAFPILIFLLSAFAFNTNISVKTIESKLLVVNDSSIKKVNVPVEYLRLLQGEYESTNQPGGAVRRIIFTELLGTLFGNDNGYTYRIIPVGGEKFINPDDKATLEFNSKDKTAIKLLLFGKINLNKVDYIAKIDLNKIDLAKGKNVQNRSLPFTLANVMVKNGIPAALSYYQKAKDSSNYTNSEREMSYAGYQLLDNGKTKEAVALLKLDIELFKDNYNAYDSYAEALLLAGDKTNAKENFKRSVQLNPGSQNGLNRLKELGVNIDEVIKPVKISLEELKLLEGVYLSTDQPNLMRKITIKVEKETLTGEDNGYHYKLIPMGNGKFINPDDGESLVFDTKDKTAINMLLFGTINLKKATLSKEPALPLKEYNGRYLPAKNDTILSSMAIINDGSKLSRVIEKDPKGPNGTLELQFVTGNLFYYPDNTGRSLEFIVDDKKQVTGCILKRFESTYKLTKEK